MIFCYDGKTSLSCSSPSSSLSSSSSSSSSSLLSSLSSSSSSSSSSSLSSSSASQSSSDLPPTTSPNPTVFPIAPEAAAAVSRLSAAGTTLFSPYPELSVMSPSRSLGTGSFPSSTQWGRGS